MRAAVVIVLAGCLEVPDPPGHECATSSDCNQAAGEVCEDGRCWGNPPAGGYAATLSPPAVREDLVSTEFATLSFPADGWLDNLAFEPPVTIGGRVEMACPAGQPNCSTLSIAAEIRITRPSRFPGGPAVRLSALSKPGVPRGTDSFTIRVPRTLPDDPPYKITIDPEGGGDAPPGHGGKDPAELVPPKRLLYYATTDLEHQSYVLGSATPATITGVLKDPLANYLTNYRVVALGRWDTTSAPTRVSSVWFSPDGYYSIALSDGIVGPVEIVAKPFGPQAVAPELHALEVEAYGPQLRNLAQPTGLGGSVPLSIRVEGYSSTSGEVKPVAGARVRVHGVTDGNVAGGVAAVLSVDATTDQDGIARLALLDGSALTSSYRLDVVPPAGSDLGVVYGAPVVVQAQPPPVRLPKRVQISGTVNDFTGQPLADVSVTARRSLRFLWSLDASAQAFLNEIPAAISISQGTGEFSLWVDPAIANVWGHYDMYFEMPDGSAAPNWSIPDFEIPRNPEQETISLPPVAIPDAAYLHGKVVDAGEKAVEGGSLRVFQLLRTDTVCQQVVNAPDECEGDARVMGHGESNAEGIVQFNLARP